MIDLGGIPHSSTGVRINLPIYRSDDGMGMTGLDETSSGLSIAHSYNNFAGAVDTSAATSSIQNIAVLYTFATPSAGFVRFEEIDATSRPGRYQLQFENSVFSQSGSTTLFIDITGVTDMLDMQYMVQLDVITLADINNELGVYGVPTLTELTNRTLLSADYAEDIQAIAIIDDIADLQTDMDDIIVDIAAVSAQNSAILVDTTAIEVDTNIIISRIPSGLTVGGRMIVAVQVINGRIVTGTGDFDGGTPWADGGAEV